MTGESPHEAVAATMQKINDAWLRGRTNDLVPLVDPHIVMAPPGLAERITGRDAFLAGFDDFTRNATIREFRQNDQHIDVVESTAVVTSSYDMTYERSHQRYRATGTDLWVFQKQHTTWIAVWRTMLDTTETATSS